MRDAEDKARWAIRLVKLRPTSELVEHTKKILGFLESFDEIDLSGVEPMVSPIKGVTLLRDDEPEKPIPRSHALRDAPDTQAGFFRGPRP